MAVLTKSALRAIRRAAEKLLTDEAAVYHATETVTDSGPVLSYPGVASLTVKCLVSALDQRPLVQLSGERVTTTSEWDILVPAESDVRVTDRITVTFNLFDSVTTQTFEVVKALAPDTFEALRTVRCKIVD
ncbi:MAG TPA: DUF6093 family protein [Blastocatellia bacterium]|nr:DUF6093 family protein [Blastocatellia bacterium]